MLPDQLFTSSELVDTLLAGAAAVSTCGALAQAMKPTASEDSKAANLTLLMRCSSWM
jgi:hypothetical protein